MRNKGLDPITAGATDRFRAAEVGGVGFDERRIEVVLADEETEFVAEPGPTIVRAVGVPF